MTPELASRVPERAAAPRPGGVQAQTSPAQRLERASRLGHRPDELLPSSERQIGPPNLSKAPGQGRLQREIVNDRDQVVLDRFDSVRDIVKVVAPVIFAAGYRANPEGFLSYDALYDALVTFFAGNPAIQRQIADPTEAIPLSTFAKEVVSAAHTAWLTQASGQASPEKIMPTHEQIQQGAPPFLAHYNLFDTNMLWRFTSKPSSEQVFIKGGTSYDEISDVVAQHSGGNDKSNPDVKTLSFGRNPSALMGVAASKGGDKHVLNIIDKAAYLYGIDISTLAAKGITAHAANARMISLFESEYVLLNTPGFPALNLDQLATVKYRNPFRGRAIRDLLANQKPTRGDLQQMGVIIQEMGEVEPDPVPGAEDFPQQRIETILTEALKVKRAADPMKPQVMDKERLDPRIAGEALTAFNKSLR